MRDLKFKQRYGAADERALSEIEVALGASLPSQYRAYLLGDGGGFAPEYRFFKVASPAGEWHWVNEFFEWRQPAQVAASLLDTREMFRHREEGDFGLPGQALSIASATGGLFQVVIGVAGQWRDKVYLVNINERPEDPDWSYFVSIADSFDAWLQSLLDASKVPPEYRD